MFSRLTEPQGLLCAQWRCIAVHTAAARPENAPETSRRLERDVDVGVCVSDGKGHAPFSHKSGPARALRPFEGVPLHSEIGLNALVRRHALVAASWAQNAPNRKSDMQVDLGQFSLSSILTP